MIPLIAPIYYFKLSNGQIIKHVIELPDAIEKMPGNIFRQYVDENKNDFAKWVYDVFRLTELSSILGNIKSQQESARVIRAFLHQKKYSGESIMRNSQEVISLVKKNPEQNTNAKSEHHTTVKYDWKNKPVKPATIKQPVQQPKEITKKPESTESEKEIKKEVAKVVIKENNIHHNLSSETTTDADKYFDENPVLVSQMVDAKKKNIKHEILEKITYKESENPEKITDLFKDTYTKAYERLVFLRKSGFDTKLVQLMLFRIPSRIKVYEAAQEKKEAIQITRYLNEVIEELNTIHE